MPLSQVLPLLGLCAWVPSLSSAGYLLLFCWCVYPEAEGEIQELVEVLKTAERSVFHTQHWVFNPFDPILKNNFFVFAWTQKQPWWH